MPGPWWKQPDSFPGPVRKPIHDFSRFCDARTAEHINNNRNNAFSRDLQARFNNPVEAILLLRGRLEKTHTNAEFLLSMNID